MLDVRSHERLIMKTQLRNPSLVLLLVTLAIPGSLVWGQESNIPDSAPERTAAVQRALQVVEQYISAEKSSAGERVESRGGMVEFKFKSTRENGRFRMLTEKAWREWEMDRSEDREVQLLEVMGEPQVEKISEDLVRVNCAVHLSLVENGKPWEGVSLRSFEVGFDGDGEPRIRHERMLANREGIQPGQWKKLMKAETESSRTNLRSSPSSSRNNIIGKVENGEALHVWNQEEERWLLVRTEGGLIGFVHRSQIDFEARPTVEESSGSDVDEPGRPRSYPFAVVLPGKPGYVLNPYTNTMVDVQGLKPGTLVRDPRDPDKERPFRVPFVGRPSRAVIVDEEE